jgi:hypothetical protein
MLKSDLIQYSSKLMGWQKTRAVLKLTDAVHTHYDEMKCNDWLGCIIFFHDQPEFFKPAEGAFIIPWDFQKAKLVRYFGETAQLALADPAESTPGIEGNKSPGSDKEQEDDAVLDPTKMQQINEAYEYFTRPARDQAFEDLVATTIQQAARFRKSPEEKQALEAHSNALARETLT